MTDCGRSRLEVDEVLSKLDQLHEEETDGVETLSMQEATMKTMQGYQEGQRRPEDGCRHRTSGAVSAIEADRHQCGSGGLHRVAEGDGERRVIYHSNNICYIS